MDEKKEQDEGEQAESPPQARQRRIPQMEPRVLQKMLTMKDAEEILGSIQVIRKVRKDVEKE